MLRFPAVGCVVLAGFAVVATFASAENWPGWRGPRGDGTSREPNVPTRWDGRSNENIAWKTALPGEGHASPIVWEDDIFVTACLPEQKIRVLVALDRRTGDVRWQRPVIEAPLETKHQLNSYASSTPTTDGKTVYVSFLQTNGSTVPAPNVGRPRPVTPGRMVIAAYDFEGNRKWAVEPGEFVSAHGYCSNPVLYGDLVIVNGDHDGDSYIVALNKATGETVWKIPRKYKTRSYVTPLIREYDGQTQMIVSGSKRILSVDPRNGTHLWAIEGPTEQFVASMVDDGRKLYMAAGFPSHHVMAIRPDGRGDVTATHIAWHSTDAKCYVPSPVVVDGYLLVADDRGTANCFDTKTGERLWQGRLGRHFSASLVTAGGLVYFPADDGETILVEPGPELKIVAENKLGEFVYASPAISQGQIFLRGESHLYCIGTRAADDNDAE